MSILKRLFGRAKQEQAKKPSQLEKQAKVVAEATGWTIKKAKTQLKAAKAEGVPYYRYVANECWKMTIEEAKALNERIEAKKLAKEKLEAEKKKNKRIKRMSKLTDWSDEKICEELDKAEAMGISEVKYTTSRMYLLSDEEVKEFAEVLEKRKVQEEENHQYYIDIAVKKSGKTRDEIAEDMERAKEMKISYLKYVQREVWNMAPHEKERLSRLLNTDKKRINKNKKNYVQKVAEATGWNEGKVHLEVEKAKLNCGASYEDYFVFRLFNKTPEEQKKYVTLDMFNKMRIKYNNRVPSIENFDDKAKFNENFKDLINHKWFLNTDLSYEDFIENIKDLKKIIVKPLLATQGKGISVYECNVSEEENRRIYEEIVSYKRSIVEEYIVQHEEVMGFCRSSVNTVRVLTLNYNGECKFLYSVFRMGRDGVVDNFHAGGIAATIDIPTGVICTNAVDLDGNVFETSPSTGKKIKGFQIPNWDKVIETCQKGSGRLEGTDLIGWDFAITPDGVDLIEGNPGASYVVAQIPNIEDGIGLADVMALPYI